MDNLLRPLLAVIALWWVIGYALFGIWTWDALSHYLSRVGLILFLVLPVGILASYLWRNRLAVSGAVSNLQGARRTLANTTMGALPSFAQPKKRLAPDSSKWVPPDLQAWWEGYERDHPGYAHALREAWEVMAAKPLPASPYKGGHGGATLIEHSWNVLRTLLRLKESAWPKYEGMRNSQGKVVFDLLDSERRPYVFDRKDPLPMLCAFAHDIGKVTCYEMGEDGQVRQLFDDHDSEGARLLRGLPSWRALPFDEYQRALVCVGWYHKLIGVPKAKWIDDRARALLMLIATVDTLTGEAEGRGRYAKFISRPTPVVAVARNAGKAAVVAQAVPDDDDEGPSDPGAQTAALQQPAVAAASASVSGTGRQAQPRVFSALAAVEDWNLPPQAVTIPALAAQAPAAEDLSAATTSQNPLPHIDPEELIDLVRCVLMSSAALAHGPGRVGFKYGSWLYLKDIRLNEKVYEMVKSSSNTQLTASDFDRKPGSSSDFTKGLMYALAQMGALKQEHEGKYYGQATAFYYINGASAAPGGDEKQGGYIIICRAFAFGEAIFMAKDAPREPTISSAVYHNNPLRKAEAIERVRACMQAWIDTREPKRTTLDIKAEQIAKVANKEAQRMKEAGVDRAPFDLSVVSSLAPEELAAAFVRDAQGQPCYRASALLGRFDPPNPRHFETIDIDGEPHWRKVPASTKK